MGELVRVSGLYPSVFTAGKTPIKKSRKIYHTTTSQSVAEQLLLVNFFMRGAIINGAFLSAEKISKGMHPNTLFGNIAFQDLVPGLLEIVPIDVEAEWVKVALAHKELGEV